MMEQTEKPRSIRIEPRDPPSRPTSPRRPPKAAHAKVAYEYEWVPFDRDRVSLRNAADKASGLRRAAAAEAEAAAEPASAPPPVSATMPRVPSYNPPNWPFTFSTSFEDEDDY